MSHTFKSAAAFYSAANGKRVRKVCTGVATAEQWPPWPLADEHKAFKDNLL